MDPRLPHDFREFLRLLNANGVEHLLIGGYAVGYYGYPQATHDLDVWIALHAESICHDLRAKISDPAPRLT